MRVRTLKVHERTSPVNGILEQTTVVEFVLTGHIPQSEASILYELAEQFGATFVQLKVSPSEPTVVRFTSLGAGNGSA